MYLPANLQIVADAKKLPSLLGERSIHVTNGTFINSADIVVPSTLAGFQAIADDRAVSDKYDAFLIAINSDKSLQRIMSGQGVSQDDIRALESQNVRAVKVAVPLAMQHQDRKIYVTFYDEETPNKLYDFFASEGVVARSLHKNGGYGIGKNARKIEGAEHFGKVIAFALPTAGTPVCYDVTPRETQRFIDVRDLAKMVGPHGGPYLSREGKILFRVHDEVYQYTQAHADAVRAIEAQNKASSVGATFAGPVVGLP